LSVDDVNFLIVFLQKIHFLLFSVGEILILLSSIIYIMNDNKKDDVEKLSKADIAKREKRRAYMRNYYRMKKEGKIKPKSKKKKIPKFSISKGTFIITFQ
jgi:hypothetical protein